MTDKCLKLLQLQEQLEWAYYKHLDGIKEMEAIEVEIKLLVDSMTNEDLYKMQSNIEAIENILETL